MRAENGFGRSELKDRQRLTAAQRRLAKQFREQLDPRFRDALAASLAMHLRSLVADPTQAEAKLSALQKLGFTDQQTPTQSEFLQHYLAWLDARGIAEDDRMLPAVVLVRGSDTDPQFALVVPGIDAWPTEPGYRFYALDAEPVNLPYAVVFAGMKANRYPLLAEMHDVFHFLSFASHPDYTAGIVAGMRRLATADAGSNDLRSSQHTRVMYLVELLTLADPEQSVGLKEFLAYPKRAANSASFADYKKYFDALPTWQFLAHACKLARGYDFFLRDFGAIVTSSWEKGVAVSAEWQPYVVRGRMTHEKILDYYLSPREAINGALFPETMAMWSHMLQGLLDLQAMPSEEFAALVTPHPYFARYFCAADGALRSDYQTRLEALLRFEVTRMEYAAWLTATEVKVGDWLADLLCPRVDPNSKTAALVRCILPGSTLCEAIEASVT